MKRRHNRRWGQLETDVNHNRAPTDPPPPNTPVVISSTRDIDLLEGEVIAYHGSSLGGLEAITIEQTGGRGPFTLPWRGVKWRPLP